MPGLSAQACISAGSGNGVWSLQACLRQGRKPGRSRWRCGLSAADLPLPRAHEIDAHPLEALWRVPAERDPDRCPKQFLDFQNDTCVADIRLAVREGYRSIEHVKRYTALGFGTDQGKLGNINGMAVLAEAWVSRFPRWDQHVPAGLHPRRLWSLRRRSVGSLFDPVRKTPFTNGTKPRVRGSRWSANGCGRTTSRRWEDRRPRWRANASRPAPGRYHGCLHAGKIDVQGADAVTFLERVYTHDVGKWRSDAAPTASCWAKTA